MSALINTLRILGTYLLMIATFAIAALIVMAIGVLVWLWLFSMFIRVL